MSETPVSAALRRRVQERASGNCEYCLLSETDAYFSHEPDHIIASKHDGPTEFENLCWSCFDCNRFKGSDIASQDPVNDELVRLFNPRKDMWKDLFKLDDSTVVGLTPSGRATIEVQLSLTGRNQENSFRRQSVSKMLATSPCQLSTAN